MPTKPDRGSGEPPSAARTRGVRGLLPRWRTLVDGDVAGFPPHYREHVVKWQERRTRYALMGLMSLFALVSALKAALVLAGIWEVESPAWLYGVLATVIALAALGYRHTRSHAAEAVVALPLLAALLLLSFDPAMLSRGEATGGTLGLILLLPAITIPVLVLLRSALVLALLCAALGAWFLWHSGWSISWKLGFVSNLTLSIAGGLMLRLYRANMSLGVLRSLEAAITQATTDGLTGLMNRQGWFQAAERLLADAQDSDREASLLFLDLDDFKKLNDTHGHAIGDEVLRRTGQALAARMNAGALAGRIGGEEFVCLLPGQTPEQARRLAERLASDLKAGPQPVTFSAGVAQWEKGLSLSELMARADAAMYAAKQRGRDRVL